MTRDARILSGIILLTVPAIQYGGYFLLRSLMDRSSGYMESPMRQNFFRAGHAHAGVLVLLALICQPLADAAALPAGLLWLARTGAAWAAILMPLGFFLSMPSPDTTRPDRMVYCIYAGAVLLALSIVTLGIGLLRR